jgi:hypothetical protein
MSVSTGIRISNRTYFIGPLFIQGSAISKARSKENDLYLFSVTSGKKLKKPEQLYYTIVLGIATILAKLFSMQ